MFFYSRTIIRTPPRHLSNTNCNLLNVPLKIEYQLFLHLPYLCYPSMHLCTAQERHGMHGFCVPMLLFNNLQQRFSGELWVKGPVHLTQPSATVLSVAFNDSLDQSGDRRGKEKRACSNFSLYRHEIVVHALLSVCGGGQACGHCCF